MGYISWGIERKMSSAILFIVKSAECKGEGIFNEFTISFRFSRWVQPREDLDGME